MKPPKIVNPLTNHYAVFAECNVSINSCYLWGTSYIGFNTYIGEGSQIRHYCEFGRYCSVGRNVSIGLGQHNSNCMSTSPFFKLTKVNEKIFVSRDPIRRVIVGNDVWIGDNASILSGLKIGDGAIIGAGAVVTKDVKPYSIVGGVPAKIIKMRFDESTINDLQDIEWWNLNPSLLQTINVEESIESNIHKLNKLNTADNFYPVSYRKLFSDNREREST